MMFMLRKRKAYQKLLGFFVILCAIIVIVQHLRSWWKERAEKERFRCLTLEYLGRADYGLDDRDPEVSCRFPLPSPLEREVMAYFDKATPLRCTWFKKSYWTEMDRGVLKMNTSAFQPSKWYTCRYSEISRPAADDHDVIYGPFHDLLSPVVPESDFVYVECINVFGFPLYHDFFAYAQRDKTIRKYEREDELSVAMIGIDSMSRMNFIRQMPQSYEYLQNELEAVTLLGFNKVGRNTYPNLIPMLTGHPPPPGNKHGHFESFRFIWDEFADAGAVTTYAEDWPTNTMFDVWGNGFKMKPTHHYLHTFYRAIHNSFSNKLSTSGCMGERLLHRSHLDYLLSILRVYADSPSFLFSLHNDMSHDSLNKPQLMDVDLKNFLKSAHEEGLLNRTVLIVFGDHGQRIEDVRMTRGGRIEDMMPLVSIVFPQNLRPEWASALRKNRNRLLSSYDFYPTFLDALSTLTTANSPFIESAKNSSLGRSFFSNIPKNRSCIDATIEDWYCTCEESTAGLTRFMRDDDVVCRQTVYSWVKKINNELIQKDKCAEVSLKKINQCKLMQTKTEDLWRVRADFITSPGDAYFEASAMWKINATSKSLIYLQLISRNNRYGHQSYCIEAKDTVLREICYCL